MKRVRFIHTSDIHLDTSFAGCGFPSRLGVRKREAIRATFRRILELARQHEAQLVLIAGDLFELDRITPDTEEFLKQQFASLRDIPVFIAPGNHDPFIHGSPYCDEGWPSNVHIFREEEFRSIDLPQLGVRVTGFGFTRTHMDDRHFLKLPSLAPDRINLVIAHGSDVASVPAGKNTHGPFRIAEIAGKNVQYCALGHYHQYRQVSNPLDLTQAWYSGIPEGRGWDEEGDCGCILGDIDSAAISAKRLVCNQYPLRTLPVDCEGLGSREQILDAILSQKGSVFDDRTILRIRLVGCPDSSLDLSFVEMEERLAGEVLHVVWDDQTQPALDFDSIAQERTLRGRFVRIMNERIAKVEGQERLLLDRARLYGLQALTARNVRLL